MKLQRVVTGAACFALFTAGVATAGTASTVSQADKAFMIEVAKANMTEAHEGQVAEANATRADVKAFGSTLDQDHTKAYQELTELAGKLGVDIPKGINVGKDPAFERMSKMKGVKFDHEFATDEVTSHRQALAIFKREAAHGQDVDVKAYAAKMVPILEGHLKMAEDCAKPAK